MDKVDNRLTVIFSDPLIKQNLKIFCAKQNKSIKEVVESAIKEYIDKYNSK